MDNHEGIAQQPQQIQQFIFNDQKGREKSTKLKQWFVINKSIQKIIYCLARPTILQRNQILKWQNRMLLWNCLQNKPCPWIDTQIHVGRGQVDFPQLYEKHQIANNHQKQQPRKEIVRLVKKNIGLTNQGNTCYINCSIQCLGSIRELADYYLTTNIEIQNGFEGQMFRLMEAMWRRGQEGRDIKQKADALNTRKPSPNPQAYSMKNFCKQLYAINEFYRQNKYRQMDAAEFIQNFLNILCDPAKAAIGTAGSAKNIFEGFFHTTIVCKACPYKIVDINQRFLSLPLPIVTQNSKISQNSIKLTQCLSNFSKKTILDQENKWFCKQCNQDRECQKRMSILNTGNVLILHLLRFTGVEKVHKIVEYDKVLYHNDQQKQQELYGASKSNTFTLIGVICHLGLTIRSGHYISYTLNQSQGVWYKYSDSQVSKAQQTEYLNHPDAYVLFYQRDSLP